MAYRTYVNGTQIFGNNECYKEWVDFLRSKGIEMDEDGRYEGEIDDVMGMFETVDKITRGIIAARHKRVLKGETDFYGNPIHEMTDLSNSRDLDDDIPVLYFNFETMEHAYCFLPYQVYKAVEDVIERIKGCYENDGVRWLFCTYRLKDGEKIKVSAY